MADADPTPLETTRELFVAWREPESSRWYTVGRLVSSTQGYAFEYTKGFEAARAEATMRTIFGFPNPDQRYVSPTLFPLFTNRLMRRSRPDYPTFLRQLGLDEAPDPIDILARSQGYRATDHFRVYLRPQPVPSNKGPRYRITCFIAGLRFRSPNELTHAKTLKPGDTLSIVPEPESPLDPHAHRVETRDGVVIGYVPRYCAADLTRLAHLGLSVSGFVEQNNMGHAPMHRAVLCQIDAPWPDGFEALHSAEHKPMPHRDDRESTCAV